MFILNIIKSIVLGIVEGITEWLPISSTGHMILFDEFLGLNMSKDFKEMFLVVIQLGAILAVVILFWGKLWPFSRKKTPQQRKNIWLTWLKVLIASIPAGIVGFAFDSKIDEMLTGDFRVIIVSAALIFYGICFILVENVAKKPTIRRSENIGYKTALYMGLFQTLALVPGTSRSGATIIGAMLIGCSRVAAAEFSFYMSIPAMFGGSGVKVLKYFAKGNTFSAQEFAVLAVGTVVAFVVSLVCIKFLMNYIKKHDFKVFGWYRIALGALLLLLVLTKVI